MAHWNKRGNIYELQHVYPGLLDVNFVTSSVNYEIVLDIVVIDHCTLKSRNCKIIITTNSANRLHFHYSTANKYRPNDDTKTSNKISEKMRFNVTNDCPRS